VNQEKLLEIDPELVQEHEFAITGATGLDGGEELQPDDVVKIDLTADVVEIRVKKRRKKIKGTDEHVEYWVRVVVLKVDAGAKIVKLEGAER